MARKKNKYNSIPGEQLMSTSIFRYLVFRILRFRKERDSNSDSYHPLDVLIIRRNDVLNGTEFFKRLTKGGIEFDGGVDPQGPVR